MHDGSQENYETFGGDYSRDYQRVGQTEKEKNKTIRRTSQGKVGWSREDHLNKGKVDRNRGSIDD